MTESGRERHRWVWLGLTRFVLAGVVVVFHIHRRIGLTAADWITALDGRVSVIAFLVISGYSIGASLEKSAIGFYRRRLLRIYPLLIGAVLLTQVLAGLSPLRYAVSGWANALGNVVFPPGLLWSVPTLNLPLWSLGVELAIYWAAPFLLDASVPVRVLMMSVSMAAYTSPLVLEWSFGAPVLCFLWPWLLGFELYRSRGVPLQLFAFGTTALLMLNPSVSYAPSSMVQYVGTLGLVVTRMLPAVRGRFRRLFDTLGAVSFPLYLVHFPVVVTLADTYGIRDPLAITGAVLGVTLVFHHGVDGPGRRLLTRLLPDDSGGTSRPTEKTPADLGPPGS